MVHTLFTICVRSTVPAGQSLEKRTEMKLIFPLNSASSLPILAAAVAERPKEKRGELQKSVTDYLRDWLHRHPDHPYPSEDEKKQLCQATGPSISQVSNWMINLCPSRSVPSQHFTFIPLGPPSDSRTSPACTGRYSRFV